jgi:hypothetical protein
MLTHTIAGCDERAYIAEQPRLHPSLRFKFRPMLAEERDTIANAGSRKTPSEYHQILAAALAARIKDWDAKKRDGHTLSIEAATVRTLQPRLFDRVYAIVCGDSASDVDPQSPAAEVNLSAEAALQAAISGQSVGEVKQEADRKNSSPA